MMMEMYAIKDELNGFTPPIPLANEETAKRYFREQLKLNPTINITPKDFSIWFLGEFNTETGEFYSKEIEIRLLERG